MSPKSYTWWLNSWLPSWGLVPHPQAQVTALPAEVFLWRTGSDADTVSSGPSSAGRIWFMNEHLGQLWMHQEVAEGMMTKRKNGIKTELSLPVSFQSWQYMWGHTCLVNQIYEYISGTSLEAGRGRGIQDGQCPVEYVQASGQSPGLVSGDFQIGTQCLHMWAHQCF